MSVTLLIQKPPPEPAKLVPIASEEVYGRQWVEAAVKLGLQWLPLFQTGQPVPAASLPEVIAEFEMIRQNFILQKMPLLAARAKAAADALREVLLETAHVEVYIG